MTLTLGILRGVLDFYKQGPHTWTQGVWARDANGNPVRSLQEAAVCHCLFSAVIRETNRHLGTHYVTASVRRALREQLERDGEIVTNITLWNDDKDRWHGDVLSLL